jgi:polyhydroxyalkanoate synthesis regulator phasin
MNDLEKLIDRLVKDGKTNTIDDDGNRLYPNLKEALNKSIKKQEQKKLKDKKFRKNLSDKFSNCLGLNNKKHNH